MIGLWYFFHLWPKTSQGSSSMFITLEVNLFFFFYNFPYPNWQRFQDLHLEWNWKDYKSLKWESFKLFVIMIKKIFLSIKILLVVKRWLVSYKTRFIIPCLSDCQINIQDFYRCLDLVLSDFKMLSILQSVF